MTRNEFRKRLDQLREVITRGLAHYTVWSKLRLHDKAGVSWSLVQQNKVLGRFRGLFSPVALALMDMALMQFAKAFDADSRTASLPVLLSAAQKDPSLVSGKPSAELSRISTQLQQNIGTLSALKQMRNQQLAHVDSNPRSVGPLMSQNIESLAEDVKSAFNWLSTAHDGNVTDWDFLLRTSGQHTTDVLNILLEEVGRKQEEHQEEIVRIVRDDIRRREMLAGRPLDKEEMWSVEKEYGLTEEQRQRIEEEYGSR